MIVYEFEGLRDLCYCLCLQYSNVCDICVNDCVFAVGLILFMLSNNII
jgi:hypothetical protein